MTEPVAATPPGPALLGPAPLGPAPLRLHIGGHEVRPGWRIVDVEARPEVDHVTSCTDLTSFAADSVEEIYASHILEHLDHQAEILQALREFHRVLRPGGRCCIAVPDFEELCRLFLDVRLTSIERWRIMVLVFGGQKSPHDFHKVGLTYDFLKHLLAQCGFSTIERVADFGLFNDASTARIVLPGRPDLLNLNYSLNVVTAK